MQSIGILGGTFNPVHIGHIALARAATQTMGFAQTLIMPAGMPPLKNDSDPGHRLAMVRLACQGTGLTPCGIELDMPGPSYTEHTLRWLQEKYAQAQLWFIIGQDNLEQMPQWHGFSRLCKLCGFAAGLRPGCGNDPVAQASALREEYGARIALLPFIGPDISSTAIRKLVAEGRDITPYVGEKVANYIKKRDLYGREDTSMG